MKQILKTKFFTTRGVTLGLATMFLFTTVVVQPVQAQSSLNTIKCNAINLLATTAVSTMKFSVNTMNAVFKLQIDLLMAAWDIEDKAVALTRSISMQAFLTTLNVYSAITARSQVEKQAVETYKQVMLNAVLVVQVKIDAARAAYREDMLALVKAHQKALTDIVTTAVGSITAALDVAKANCSAPNVVTTLIKAIAAVNITKTAAIIKQDVTDLAKAAQLVLTRNRAFIDADTEFLKTATAATLTLLKATLGSHPDPTTSPSPSPAV